MSPARAPAVACAAALLLSALPARGYDPRLDWHTLETPHFRVHFHDGLGELAQRSARALEAAYRRVSPDFGRAHEGRLDVVLSDETDAANGYATVWIRSQISLLAVPPDSRSELGDVEDYLWNLVVHEYTHIVHMSEVDGVPAVANKVLGQMWLPNGIAPRWLLEGLAVHEETRQSGGGRGRASVYDMYLRAEFLQGGVLGVDDASGLPSVWPRATLWYLHGGLFVRWVAETFGQDALASYFRDYGSQIVPYAINYTAKDQLGATWTGLYDQWRKEVEARYDAQVSAIRAKGETPLTRLTFRGESTGEPLFLDDKRLIYLEDSADRRANLRTVGVGGEGDATLREVYGGGTLALSPDRTTAIVSQLVTHREFYFYEDLFRVDLKSGALDQLTFGARVTEADFSPDGKTLVVARRLSGGRMGLAILPAAGGEPKPLYEPPAPVCVYTPRFSTDGKRIAFSEQRPTGRDIRILDLATGTIEDVTHDRALDLDPVFDARNGALLFVSDRTGVFDVYARDLGSGETFQVTNVVSGAFRPALSPDGKTLAVVTYTTRGYDVAVTAYDRESWRPAPAVDLARPPAPDWQSRELYPIKPYRPIESLRPYYWLPILGADLLGTTLGITTSGNDVVGKHSWALTAEFGLASKEPTISAGYATQLYYPDLGLEAGTGLGGIPGAPGVIERQYHGSASLNFPFTHLDQRYAVGVGWEGRYFAPWDQPAPHDPTEDLPFKVDRGFASTLSLSLGFSNVQSFPNGISPERGLSLRLNLRGARPEWGSRFRYAAVEGSLTKHTAMPWLEHHALALRLTGGWSTGDLGGRRVFSLGGLSLHDPILDLVQWTGVYGAGLRGYRPGAFSGSTYTLLNAEYRFPIARVDRGLWTLPLYLRRIHGAVTCDVGEAADKWTWRGLKASAGLELRGEIYIGYAVTVTLRAGYARGFMKEGVDDFFLGLGNSF